MSDLKKSTKNTALMLSIIHQDHYAFKALLKARANIRIKNFKNEDALDVSLNADKHVYFCKKLLKFYSKKRKIESLKVASSKCCLVVVANLLQCNLTKKDYEKITNYLMLRFANIDNHFKKILNKALEPGLEEEDYEFIKILIVFNRNLLYDYEDNEIKLFELLFYVDFIKTKYYENAKKELLEICNNYHYTNRISEDEYEEVDGFTFIADTDFYYKEIMDKAVELKCIMRTAAKKMQSNIELDRKLKWGI
jgi:hypothetical protein